ncbi:MAG: hypothetical protein ACFFDI_16860, partial [Promethearchaeota archaeon]
MPEPLGPIIETRAPLWIDNSTPRKSGTCIPDVSSVYGGWKEGTWVAASSAMRRPLPAARSPARSRRSL